MQLLPDWHLVLRRAWSIRLVILAAVLSGVEVALPLFPEYFSRGTFALLSALVSIVALIARLVAQPGAMR